MLRPGQVVGDYTIIEFVARGGMGAVYKVQNRITGRVEAMKSVEAAYLQDDPAAAPRFLREVKIFASIDHPNVVRLFTAFEWESNHYMTMEFVEGATLDQLVRNQPAHPSRAAEIVRQVLRALEHIHTMGIIHRDIKLSNIMLASDGAVKLMDFGISRIEGQTHLTRAGSIAGTLLYVAPELLLGAQPDARSDIYAVGVLLYRLVGGRYPFEGDSEGAILRGHQEGTPPPLRTLAPNVPENLAAAIERALEKKPDDRWQSAANFLAALSPDSISTAQVQDRLRRTWWTRTSRRYRYGAVALLVVSGVLCGASLLAPQIFRPRAAGPIVEEAGITPGLGVPRPSAVTEETAELQNPILVAGASQVPEPRTVQPPPAPAPPSSTPPDPAPLRKIRPLITQRSPEVRPKPAQVVVPELGPRKAELLKKVSELRGARAHFDEVLKSVSQGYGLRQGIAVALTQLESFTSEGEKALGSGDLESSARLLAAAEEQVAVLNKEIYRK